MMLPRAHEARVDRVKIVAYLLCGSHPDGQSKARFFTQLGFSSVRWQELADALKALALSNSIANVVESTHGRRYTVDGRLQSPDGRRPWVRTIWIVEGDGIAPRLVTAYPL
jgi:hypothetical protein